MGSNVLFISLMSPSIQMADTGWRSISRVLEVSLSTSRFVKGWFMRVKATREGLIGGKTSTGYIVDTVVPFVALPAVKALHRFVRVRNPVTGRSCLAIVLDVGPWNEHDDAYVFNGARPSAESGRDTRGRVTNKAGIDLGERVWKLLEMTDNTEVEWWFIA